MNKRQAFKLSYALITLSVFCGGSVYAAQVDVTPSSMGSWAFDNRDVNGIQGANPNSAGAMVTGPAGQPLGTGSASLIVGNGAIGGGGDGTEELRNTSFDGVGLVQLSELIYYTYMTQNNGQQFPYLGLMVNKTGGTTVDDILFFEPPYQTPLTGNPALPDQGDTQMNAWQDWDAFHGGWWWNDGAGSGGTGTPGTGVGSLGAYILQFPLATIRNAADGLGGVRFNVGFASDTDKFNGNVDAFTIGVKGNSTTFNFDPDVAAPVPEATTILLLGSGLAGLAIWGRRKNRQV